MTITGDHGIMVPHTSTPYKETMLSNITNVVRSNQNAVMVRVGNGSASSAIYTIFELKTQSNTYTGTLNACKKAWNKHYANSRQFVTKSGMNHRFMGA